MTHVPIPTPSDDTAEARVILVGRTGLDGMLRRDASLELIRVRSAAEALAEVATGGLIHAASDQAPARPVVLVAPDAEPPTSPTALTPGTRDEFLRALREADARVRVLRVQLAGATPSGYDGTLAPDADLASFHAAAQPAAAVTPPAPSAAPAPAAPKSPPPSVPAASISPRASDVASDLSPEPAADVAADLGDESLLRLVLAGHDVHEPALALLRTRLGSPALRWIEARESEPAGQPVMLGSSIAGWIDDPTIDPARLRTGAAWLSEWMRLASQVAQLREAAFQDPLTGAWNRRYFDKFLAAAIARARDARRFVTIMVFDIDNFKHYNDRFGHDLGDDILKDTVRLLRSTIRPTDRVCRIGGDEFAVIFDEPEGPRSNASRHPTDVLGLARRFQQQIASHKFPKLGSGLPSPLSVSGGLATFPWDGLTPDDLVRAADQRAIQSKQQGKNAMTFGPTPSE
ncbi:MAG: GGDEF domain-containing protein [Planctomycetota bacterium]|nr:GGDEF domain-containing protein [Planctomycetota bacterium]